MTRTLGLALGLALVLGLAGPAAFADSGNSSGYTKKAKDPAYVEAAGLVEKGKYAEAIPRLDKVVKSNPKDADAHNLLGYSHRKLGDWDRALSHYQTALKLVPDHLGANEYLGELYLEMGKLDKAEERLSKLDWACLFGCDEYTELKQAIAAYKAKNGG